MNFSAPSSMPIPEDIADAYGYGKCMFLAAALHRRLGHAISLVLSDPSEPPQFIEHAWVEEPVTGLHIDIDGAYPPERNGWMALGGDVQTGLTEADLRAITQATAVRRLSEHAWEAEVREALTMVERYWLPAYPAFKESMTPSSPDPDPDTPNSPSP